MTADVSRETNVAELPMARVHTRRINPVDITTPVQITIVICLTLVLLVIVSAIAGV